MGTGIGLSDWVDFVAEATRKSVDAFPVRTLLGLLSATFETTTGWTWLTTGGRHGSLCLHPPAEWPPPGAVDVWGAHMFEHPLHRWYLRTRLIEPMTMERVPRQIADRRCVEFTRDALGSVDVGQQLGIPVRMPSRAGGEFGSFVVSRGGTDFTAGQLATALQLQPLLMVLERHTSLTARADADLATCFDLTARESAVLYLLRQGLTIAAIGHNLRCSPRTAEKHVEHIYRKMGVRDRLAAIRLADAWSLSGVHAASASAAVDTAPAESPDARSDFVRFEGLLTSTPPPRPGLSGAALPVP
jgi:DNA-binding CsgD family transcriptional regulator